MICSMSKMHKKVCLIAGILFLFSTASNLWAYVEQVPHDLKKYLDEKYGRYQLFDYQKDGNGFYFANIYNEVSGKNTIVAVNPAKKDKSSVIFEYPKKFKNDISGLVYNPRNKTLYFSLYNGDNNKYNRMIFENVGIYTVTRDSQGLYLNENLHRYYIIEEWVINNVCDTFLRLPVQPDIDGFLNYFFDFADPGVTPVFCVTDRKGNVLTNREAVQYLLTDNELTRFCAMHNEYYYFPVNKYLFVADEQGNPTEKSAVSYYDTDYCFWGRLKFQFEQIQMVLYNDEVYFSAQYGSEKRVKNSTFWTWDWSEIFKINHVGQDFYITQPDGFPRIHACLYDHYKANVEPVKRVPLEVTEYGLVINDSDGESVWLFDGESSKRFDNKDSMLTHAIIQKKKPKNLSAVLLVFNIFISILLIQAIIYMIIATKHRHKRDEKIKLQIQRDERRKISYDIHDSVVQDIRAIRIETEMLEVKKTNEVRKDNLIANITNCIMKMRDICYGLSPAEFFDVKQGELVDVYSILQTLSEQFFRRTNIRCTVSADDEEDGFYYYKDDCYNIINIVQEALKNIEKHSFATSVQLFCRHEMINKNEYMTLFIIDDGRGCDIEQVLQKKNLKNHFGLKMIKDHVSMIKGSFVEFFSAPGDGMQIKISLCGVSKKQNEK